MYYKSLVKHACEIVNEMCGTVRMANMAIPQLLIESLQDVQDEILQTVTEEKKDQLVMDQKFSGLLKLFRGHVDEWLLTAASPGSEPGKFLVMLIAKIFLWSEVELLYVDFFRSSLVRMYETVLGGSNNFFEFFHLPPFFLVKLSQKGPNAHACHICSKVKKKLNWIPGNNQSANALVQV